MFAFNSGHDAMHDLNFLSKEMTRMLSVLGGRPSWNRPHVPAANFWHNEGELALTMELPGIDIDRLDVQIEPKSVRLSYDPESEQARSDGRFLKRERDNLQFERTFTLPYTVDPTEADGSYCDGMLTLKLKRPQRELPRKLTIRGQ
ncbi:MAG: Hsp20/alpha crystallin family protein [Planctomycetaceae bacterium]